jgi:hypothetical protein
LQRLLQSESIPADAKAKLREVSAQLDPLKLLEEVRAVQAYLAALADGEMPPPMTSEPPNLAAFVASLSSAWHAAAHGLADRVPTVRSTSQHQHDADL